MKNTVLFVRKRRSATESTIDVLQEFLLLLKHQNRFPLNVSYPLCNTCIIEGIKQGRQKEVAIACVHRIYIFKLLPQH